MHKNFENSGDLFINIQVKPHDYFTRSGDDIYVHIPISIVQATLGAQVYVSSVNDKKIKITIPPFTNSGRKFKISGFGVPSRGDMFVVTHINPPKELDEKAKELLLQLESIIKSSDEPYPIKKEK